jgi:hypothetical protein
MKIINIYNALLTLTLFTQLGCQTVPYQGQARIVKLKPQAEGVLALPLDPKPEDRQVAEEKMKSNCNPKRFAVLEEGEVVVGEKTQTKESSEHKDSTQRKVGSLFGLPLVAGSGPGTDTESEQVKTQVKEWQISYKCEKM